MIHSSVHTHTDFCDGSNSMEEMAAAAFSQGLKCIGFSSHSYTDHDNFGMPREKMQEYLAEARRLKAVYDGKLQVLCGIEYDGISKNIPLMDELDYVIGSIHSLRGDDGKFYVIDGRVHRLVDAANNVFGGSFELVYEAYYNQLTEFICDAKPDIVGHFDLITKYNEKYGFFDAESKRYKTAALTALDAVLDTGAVIEVNTGAITRGFRTKPYPADFLLKHIFQRGRNVIITADAHSTSTLTSFSSDAEEILKSLGFNSVLELGDKGFYERRI